MDWIYLDNNATTKPTDQVVETINECNTCLWANPSSVHRLGQNVRHQIELARQQLAELLNCKPREIIFTSGGTEANNLALRGVFTDIKQNQPSSKTQKVIITTATEHAAIREPAKLLEQNGINLINIDVQNDGLIDLGQFQEVLNQQAQTDAVILVSIQWASNETGVIQPLHKISEIIAEQRHNTKETTIIFHSDATQAVGKIPVDIADVNLDMLTCAAHKFHGPKGIGALYVRSGMRLHPQQSGGQQERQQRGGTENASGIIAMGIAAQQASQFLGDENNIENLRMLRNHLEQQILKRLPDTSINPPLAIQYQDDDSDYRLWNTSNIAFNRLQSEAILLALSENGLCASAGAACSSGSLEPSPVLIAMGVPETAALGSIRFSLSRFTDKQEINRAIDLVEQVITRIAKTLPTI